MTPSISQLERRDALARIVGLFLVFVALGGALGVSFAVTPEDIESGRVVLSPPCPLKQWTGHECLGCGLSRGFAALSHGRLGDAMGYNALSPLFYLGFWIAGAWSLWGLARAISDFRVRPRLGDVHNVQYAHGSEAPDTERC